VTLRYDEADGLAGHELAVARHHIPPRSAAGFTGAYVKVGSRPSGQFTKSVLPVACQMVSAVLEDSSRLYDRPL